MKTLSDLTAQYSQTKSITSEATSRLTSQATFKGMDSINTIVAEAMQQIEEFTSNGKKPSMLSSAGSRVLSLVDPNSRWAGKWLSSTSNSVTKESLKETTMEEIANRVISAINSQREDVVSYMESVAALRDTVSTNLVNYETILADATELLPTLPVNTREELDTKSLINRLNKSIMQATSTISTKMDPLILSASLAVQEIDAQLPDIEHDLKYEGSLKVAQQSLSDLIGMASSVKAMTEKAGDEIRKDIKQTTLESINMVGDIMIDTKRIKQLQEEEAEHMQNLNKAMQQTHQRINQNFDELNQISLDYKKEKEANTHLMIDNYSGELNGTTRHQ